MPLVAAARPVSRAGTTVEQAVQAIADAIVRGDYRPGDRLDEVSLARRLDVSRTPIREALGQLAAIGLVDRRPNRGAIVATVNQARLTSMFEAMAELEGVCARLSAERMTAEERHVLEGEHLESARLVHSANEAAYETHNTAFHTRLYRGAHNEHIYDLVVQTRSRLAPFRRAQFRLPGRLSKSYDEHDLIVTAILRADGRGAEQAARAHVAIVSDASADLLRLVNSERSEA